MADQDTQAQETSPADEYPEEGLNGLDLSDVTALLSNEDNESVSDEVDDGVEQDAPAETDDGVSTKEEEKDSTVDDIPEKTWDNVLKLEKQAREIRAENKELKAQVSQVEELQSRITELADVESFIEKFKDDPISYLDEMLGIDGFMAWGERIQNGGTPSQDEAVAQLRKKLERMEAKERETQEQAEQRERAEAKNAYTTQLAEIVNASGSEDMLNDFKNYNGISIAWDITAMHHGETGEILDAETAVKLAHRHIQSQLDKTVGDPQKAKVNKDRPATNTESEYRD